MTALDDREAAFELEFAHDELNRFEIRSRRNRLFGAWAAESLGHHGEAADAYVQAIVGKLLEPDDKIPGPDEQVIAKVYLDLMAAGWDVTPDDIHSALGDFEQKARQEIMNPPATKAAGLAPVPEART